METSRIKTIFKLTAIVLGLALAFFIGRIIFYRLYLGARIKGSIRLEVDGQAVELTKKELKGCTLVKFKEGKAEIKVKAEDFGLYTITIADGDLDEKIKLDVMKYNWWDVVKFDLTIKADTEAGKADISGSYSSLNDLAFRESYTVEGEVALLDDASIRI